ncbi:thiol-activated cytolysin family protein [Capnocytophaga sp. oral taxon 878]|uniref:thiol-activated cytolysin family protein n=1 Tax=Capnocytophaga sp. oral taxon 878 TaxID=1316596 RepID=UPI000D043172|nr:thiol-activated cytolysin family protein [Capnocytophaga sp. oral taxon 878]AVM50736.1 hypothetical protein C4H12_09785 [Capnocytophaga sp. oral taxon 878]
MKKSFFKIVALTILTLVVACGKNDNEPTEPIAKQLANLKPVHFAKEPDQVIATEGNWTSYSGKTLITTRKQVVLSPMEVVGMQNADVIYPGSVLRGDSFMEGKYDPIALTNPNDITISTSLQGKDLNVKVKGQPILSDFRQKINNLLKDNTDKIDYQNTPTYMTYSSEAVSTVESFRKILHLHSGIDVFKKFIDLRFDYKPFKFRVQGKEFVVVKVLQPLYNLTMNAQAPEQWGKLTNIGDTEPVYVSSVDYGRIAYLLIETNIGAEATRNHIDSSLEINLAKKNITNANIKAIYDKTVQNWFNKGYVKVVIGEGALGNEIKTIDNYQSFINYLKSPTPESLIQSAVIIGYKVRTLKDNKEVEVRATYTEEEFK